MTRSKVCYIQVFTSEMKNENKTRCVTTIVFPATMTCCVARSRPFITINTDDKLFICRASFFNSFNDIGNQFMSPRLLNNFVTCLGFSRFRSNRLKNTETGYKRAVFIGFVDKRCEYSTWFAYLFNKQVCFLYTKQRPKPANGKKEIRFVNKNSWLRWRLQYEIAFSRELSRQQKS